MSDKSGRISVSIDLPLDYRIREPESGNPRELILLLHGYSQSGGSIFSKLVNALPEDTAVLAPNGPFLIPEKNPEKSEEKYRAGYSWYFYNFQTDEYVIDMKPSLEFLATGIERLGFSGLPLRIIGFSQGGYLAPFVGERLSQTRQVISLHSTYLYQELSKRLNFRADNLVGGDDEIIDPANSERSHREILKRSRGGVFVRLGGVGHRIEEQGIARVSELVRLGC